MTRMDRDAGERRVNAYIDFLMAAYDTDLDGLAGIAGTTPAALAEFARADFARADFADKSAGVLQRLGALTGISYSWLFAEGEDGEGAPR